MNPNDVVLITGASKGLGRALAHQLARLGHPLIINARGERELREVERELSQFTRVVAVAGDVSEIAEELASLGPVDILINNASDIGPTPMPPLELYPWDALLRVFKVNAVAPFHLIQLLLPGMRSRGRGTIVNISSDAGVNAYPGWGGYGASKAALELMSRILAKEIEGSGVRVLVVDPGDMNTEMHRLAANGADLSHLPSAGFVAPRIIELLNDTTPFARVEAQQMLVAS
ncbi:MAG TPA: SDR family oxidoreductase [Thermoanaerobaculia bacterium]|jgi:NAD(P)-dependent dehydrogenase (short-subunit alcohol dehydrogenase family)|nr:SDR family oxidoreductase [Thermoanaerobaculia bacterium]